ncbi:MAG: heme ABC exporter ATP-binding protein CcmA [candidate division KSB1 bacterium]|nr:heme ABC exporter ATP-binding protein CcmA [candidate division KSB1 bacterium]
MVEVRSLTKVYGTRYALREVSFQARAGRVLGVFGPNGAGKSTLIRILAGQTRPTSGQVFLLGKRSDASGPELRRHVGVIGHHTYLYEELTALENLRFYARMYGLRFQERELLTALAKVGLEERAHEPVRAFSRGMLQRLALARATLHDPSILLLDEPYTGLDQSASALLDELLKEMRGTGRTILVVTHDVERGLELVDDVLVLVRGRVAGAGEAAQYTAASMLELYQSGR